MHRRARRPTTLGPQAYPFKRAIPTYDLLSKDALSAIEDQADWILKEIGIEFRGDPTALALFKEAGADVDGERVRFETGLARHLCSTAPETFMLHSRDPQKSLTLGGDYLVLMPGYGSPFVTDMEKGRRYATIEDFQNFVKLTYQTPYLNHSSGTVCEPTDLPVNKRHLDMVYAHLTLSDKPFMGSVTAASRAQDSIDMAKIVHGADFMSHNAVMQGNINVNSPLVYDETMTDALRIYAVENQCVCISPAIFAGAMGPLTPAAVVAQTLAEGMAGIALAQLINPTVPCVLGSFHSTMDLKSGALSFGSPEANLATMALSQLGRRLKIPTRSGGGQVTAANLPDAQAMIESSGAMWATLLSGAHQVWHAAGWLEGGLTMSYEKFVLDVDHCGMMLKMLCGMSFTQDDFAQESYYESGPGDNFLSTAHTLSHFAQANYQHMIPDAGPFETWHENGDQTIAQRATSCWKTMLATYQPPELDQAIREELDAFVTKRKAMAEGTWY